ASGKPRKQRHTDHAPRRLWTLRSDRSAALSDSGGQRRHRHFCFQPFRDQPVRSQSGQCRDRCRHRFPPHYPAPPGRQLRRERYLFALFQQRACLRSGPNQLWQSHYAAARLRDESRVQLYGGDRKGLGRSARVYLYLASERNWHSLPRCAGDRRALDHPLLNGSLRPARRWTPGLTRNVKMSRIPALLLLFGLACAAQAQQPDKVRFGTNWVAEAEHGGFYQAVADGTYKKYGLDVTI